MPDDAESTTDPQAIRAWLGILHGNSPGLVHISSTGNWNGRRFADLDQAAEHAAQLDATGPAGVYVRMTTLRPDAPERDQRGHRIRGSVADSAALPALWCDLDIAGPGHKTAKPLPPDDPSARSIITEAGLPDPSVWIHSGGGLYPIWLLDQPWQLGDDLAAAEALSAGWQQVIGAAAERLGWTADMSAKDLARILRIPGTVNRKVPDAPAPCRIVDGAATRYALADLRATLAVALATHPPAPPPARPSTGTTGQPIAPASGGRAGDRPGDDYTARTTWPELLEPRGWRLSYTASEESHWTRPGKDTGTSATTNYQGSDRIKVFSDNAGVPTDGTHNRFEFVVHADHAGDFTAATRALAAAGYGAPPTPARTGEQINAELLELAGPGARHPFDLGPAGKPASRPDLNVTNAAVTADWLRDHLGAGPLAGMFNRGGEVVHTPREGENGYLPLTDTDDDTDGPAQVRPVTPNTLASRIQYTYRCYKVMVDGTTTPAIFPVTAARVPLDVPDMVPGLRLLRGVTHTPIVRADGTVLVAPGYDPASQLLHLPDPGLAVPPVPDQPTADQVAAAVGLLDYMLTDFRFVTDHDRANYLGLLITPLIREMTPPPYKLGALGAPQPGSGKTLLATIARTLHGGVFRAEIPADEAELRKQITAILDVTTGAVIQFDNVNGILRSSTLAGLLTSARWDDRKLGVTQMLSRRNDRVWVVTGNNLSLGGDLARRALWITIDPAVPDPHLRTRFTIPNLEEWVKANRGALLHALLTLVRAWVVAGRVTMSRSGDGFATWIATVDGILTHARIPGTFDNPGAARQPIGSDDEDWATFLAAARKAFDDRAWTVKELLAEIDVGSLINPRPIPMDALPGDLGERVARSHAGVSAISKSLGRWLANRDGRWAGGLVARSAGERDHVKLWRIESA